jgi:hypothetical protein
MCKRLFLNDLRAYTLLSFLKAQKMVFGCYGVMVESDSQLETPNPQKGVFM